MTRRTVPLPRDWPAIRRSVARRDAEMCQLRLVGCQRYAPLGKGGQADHIVPAHLGGSDHPDNLQWVCAQCHATKTAREASNARPKRTRRAPRHPGLLSAQRGGPRAA